MLRNDKTRLHRLTFTYVSNLPLTFGEREVLREAWQKYIDAEDKFVASNSDLTLIDLIGTYARFSKIVRDLDDRYGARR